MPRGTKVRQTIFETKLYKKLRPSLKERASGIIWQRMRFLNENLSRASNRGDYSKEVSVNLDYLYDIGEKQNWKCSITGVPLEFTRGGTNWGGKWCNPNSCTIDRINNEKDYVKANVQLVIWKANYLRKELPIKEFIKLCKQITKFNS
jgi:hypothetical protein